MTVLLCVALVVATVAACWAYVRLCIRDVDRRAVEQRRLIARQYIDTLEGNRTRSTYPYVWDETALRWRKVDD